MARCSLRSPPRSLPTSITKRCTAKPGLRRALSTASPVTSASTPTPTRTTSRSNAGSVGGARQEPLTLLHKTSKLLPQVSEFGSMPLRNGGGMKTESWEKILANVYEDLSNVAPRPIRLAVCGVDESSGSEDFVTALLSNPLASSPAQAQVLKDRWVQNSSDLLTISYGLDAVARGSNIELPAPYLQQFAAPAELLEFRSPRPSFSDNNFPISRTVLSKLFEADIPIILCNPLVSSLQSVLSTPLPTNTIVAIVSAPSQPLDLDKLLAYVPKHSPKPTLLVTDPRRASDAIGLLQSCSTSSSVVQRFQDAFNSSNVSAVSRALESILHTQPDPTSNSLRSAHDTLRVRLALARLQDALVYCQASLSEIKFCLNAAFCDASRLNDRVEEVRAKVQLDFLGPTLAPCSSTPGTKPRQNEVVESVRITEAQMKDLMSRFSWWKMVIRVDEVTTLIAAALQRTWCPELERKLLVHTGELHSIQTELTKASFDLLSKHHVLRTNVLRNTLLQREISPQHRLTANILTAPIYARKSQIIEYPTTRLHVTAQRTVIGMAGGVVGGAGIGWVGWMGWLVGSGEGLFASLGMTMEPATAMGVGALTAAASIRWAVGRWEKGKRKWWEDWRRVGDGLDRDLRATLDRCIEQQVGGVARATSAGFKSLIAQREEGVAELREEVRRLEAEVKDTAERLVVDRK